MFQTIHERTKIFLENAKEKHNNKYDYSQVEYVNNHTKIKIICPTHGEFIQQPNNHINGQGCQQCNLEASKTSLEDFIKAANVVHENKYDYSQSEYINNRTPIKVICSEHGEFNPTPDAHVRLKTNCPKCVLTKNAINQALTTEEFIKRVNKIHNNKYDYSQVDYINAYKKIKIICPIHGMFIKTPHGHMYSNCGCPTCSNTPFSKIGIAWLDSIAQNEKIYIQHALNGGEFKIIGTSYKVDGYCRETNTVYEFYGDKFHGNLNRFEPNYCCQPFDDTITAYELYTKTIKREVEIKNLGYNLITIWEQDFKNQRLNTSSTD